MQSKSAEEDAAQRQEANRLPESNLAPAEELWQQPIPQKQHDSATDGSEQQNPQNRRRNR